MTAQPDEFDYIIVGSGAGGGPLAARLADRGRRVLVLEAGSNHATQGGSEAAREVSYVPALHGVSCENDELSWRFFVKHYDAPPAGQDPKWHESDDPAEQGIFYPRAAALGGCTVHNAMITITAPSSDWDELAEFLGDRSWSSQRMRHYFQRLERNQYLEPPGRPTTWYRRLWRWVRWLLWRAPEYSRGQHGFDGWLRTSTTDVSLGLEDRQLIKVLKGALAQAHRSGLDTIGAWVRRILRGRIRQNLDPNHSRTLAESPEGVVLIPLAICGDRTEPHHTGDRPYVSRGRRSSPRELMLEVQARHPDRLVIWTDCLVTRVLFEDADEPRAIGVEFLRGEKLYRAHPNPSEAEGEPGSAFVKAGGEVILCGGAFNTPQLLMLSGVGDEQHLKKTGGATDCVLRGRDGEPLKTGKDKPRRVHLAGVGRNLQDRYEVTVISAMKKEFSLLRDARFRIPAPGDKDPHLEEWRDHGTGLYTSNGAVLGIFKRSRPELPQPDLFMFGIPLPFKGYEVGYSDVGDQHSYFSWAILKSHTRNQDGTVRLRSADPLDTPLINFHYFNEKSRPGRTDSDPDLLALIEGVKFVRGIAERARVVDREWHPGVDLAPQADDRLVGDWIRRDAWGHHACGTCRMGPDEDSGAVLDSRFRVRGVGGLRVVDASIFPRIPGYFIVTNIYVASEKAADVILEDEGVAKRRPSEYPDELYAREREVVRERREAAGLRPAKNAAATAGNGEWASDVTGLALSGGGIRSATTNLGLLQAFARRRHLRRFDFLSTVSGGSYIGSFLGRCYDRLKPESDGAAASPKPAVDHVEGELANSNSHWLRWLRRQGNYIAPSGRGDWRLNLAGFLRNFLSVHVVVGMLLFAAFGIANAARYALFENFLVAERLVGIGKGDLPIGSLLEGALGPFFSPWFAGFELALLFLVLPLMVAYWIVSQDRHEHFQGPATTLLVLVAGVLLYIGVNDGLDWEPVFVALALLTAFVHVELAWRRGRRRDAAVGTGGVETQRGRTRNYLTYDLGLVLAIAGGLLAFAVVDTLGHGIQQWILEENITYAGAFASLGSALVVAIPVVRKAAAVLSSDQESGRPPSTMHRILRQKAVGVALSVVLLALPLTFYSFAAHAVYQGGSTIGYGLLVTGFAIFVSAMFARPTARTFVNRSSLAQMYAARLARAYLGASNPARWRGSGADVTEVMPGDDVASIRDYRPDRAGGPLHLINLTVNQTVEFRSQRGNRDRKGEILAVNAFGMSVGRRWHSRWRDSTRDRGRPVLKKRPTRLEPVRYEPEHGHPLVDARGEPTDRAEMLSLREWMAISGAAIGPGRGQSTALGTALLFGLANLRTGIWWDCGMPNHTRDGLPRLTWMRWLLRRPPVWFPTQTLLMREWIAHYAGPWRKFWYLSDGGFFENLGAYELIRRRVPRIVVSDAGADPEYQFADFAELVRKVRIDFGASIVPLTAEEVADVVKGKAAERVGTLADLYPRVDDGGRRISKKHAALCRVEYRDGPGSILLYVKASLTGDESPDIRQYHGAHPEFPHESTADQFFDEAQWESYRQLGEHMAEPLADDWFWKIPLPQGAST